MSEWAGTGRAVTAARERRLREAGLVEVLPGLGDSGRLVLCTRRGLGAVGREELSTPRFSPATLKHTAATARVAIGLEGAGQRVLSEHEIEARERAEGRRIFSAEFRSGRFHRPDLVILPVAVEHAPAQAEEKRLVQTEGTSSWSVDRPQARGRAGPSSARTQDAALGGAKRKSEDAAMRSVPRASSGRGGSADQLPMRSIPGASKPIAVEVELTDKSARRLDAILRAWRRALGREQFGRVLYLCSARALPYVQRAALRTRTDGLVAVEPLNGQLGETASLQRGP